MIERNIDAYILKGGHRLVEGWLEDGALSFLLAVDGYQKTRKILGAIAEIGVHHGRFFIALSMMRREEEFGVAVDIFERQELNLDRSGSGDYAKFTANLATHGVSSRQAILTRDSLTLQTGEIAAAAQHQPIRLFSVDGSHTAQHTENDLKVAQDALAPGGVVILDDWFNGDWPGVQEGFFSYMRNADTTLVPFAYGNGKLFLTHPGMYEDYFNYIKVSLRSLIEHHKTVRVCGYLCHHLRLSAPFQGMSDEQQNSTLLKSRDPLASRMYRKGWAEPEEWGRWTIGPEAEIEMQLPPGEGSEMELRASIASFFAETRPTQVVSLACAGKSIGDWIVSSEDFGWFRMTFQLPNGVPANSVVINLTFLTIQSPKAVGLSDDERELGIRVREFVLERTRGGWLDAPGISIAK